MPSTEVWVLSLVTVFVVLLIVLFSRRAQRPPKLALALPQELRSRYVRELDLAAGRCGVSASAFVDPMPEYHRRQYGALRRFTRAGGGVVKLPSDLKAALVAEYASRRHKAVKESGPNFVAFGPEEQRPTMVWLTGSQALEALHRFLQQELEAWAASGPLEHTATYGIREYHRGSKLEQHVDRPHTHAISAIVNVATEGLEHEWPLHLLPHDASEVCAVKLRDASADVLFYESATVPHGRLDALAGDCYANVFVHYRPTGWKEHATAVMGPPPAS